MKKYLIIILVAILAILAIFAIYKFYQYKGCKSDTDAYRKTLQNSASLSKYSKTEIENYAKINYNNCMSGYQNILK